jgi:hypothetical protein
MMLMMQMHLITNTGCYRGAAPERVANAGTKECKFEAQPPSVLQPLGECMSGNSETRKCVG